MPRGPWGGSYIKKISKIKSTSNTHVYECFVKPTVVCDIDIDIDIDIGGMKLSLPLS